MGDGPSYFLVKAMSVTGGIFSLILHLRELKLESPMQESRHTELVDELLPGCVTKTEFTRSVAPQTSHFSSVAI